MIKNVKIEQAEGGGWNLSWIEDGKSKATWSFSRKVALNMARDLGNLQDSRYIRNPGVPAPKP